MAKVTVDGQVYELREGQNLLEACLTAGLDLPYFCWHPAMGSVGACRQCALVQYQDVDDTKGRIVMGCMTPVTDGAIFSLSGDRAGAFRQGIIESLMINHPHDCAVCAEGGECHLQDMTVMVGHRDRRYRGRKKTYRNQYLGPLINHEMNRCITCYRCTRYYRDYAGGTDLAALASRDHVYFGRHADGTLESEFAGNLVEVCPTGVFTDKTLVGQYTRKWDLQSAPSICAGCAVGCNTLPGERYGKLKRVHNRFNAEVNGYFLCDRGRFGSGYVNSDARINFAGLRDAGGRFDAVHTDAARTRLLDLLEGRRVAAVGSPRASVEANFLLRSLVGAENFSPGFSDNEQPVALLAAKVLGSSSARVPSLADVEAADAVLVLGDDLTHTAPRLALALRQSVRNKAYELASAMKLQVWQDAAIRNLAQEQRSPLVSVTPGSTRLDDIAQRSLYRTPSEIAEFAQAVAAALQAGLPEGADEDSEAQEVARILATAKRPLVIAGTSLCNSSILEASGAIADALVAHDTAAMLSIVLPEANSLGQALLVQDTDAPTLAQLGERAESGQIDTLLVLENDLYRRADQSQAEHLMDAVEQLIVLDALSTPSCDRADLVLPAASVIESEGSFVSMEGRAQRFFAVFPPPEERRSSVHWLLDCLRSMQPDTFAGVHYIDQVVQICAEQVPALAGIREAAPDHDYRSHGLRIPRQPQRYSGRTAMRANISVHEPKQTSDDESPLAYSMEGLNRDEDGALLPFVWSPGWNSNQSLHKFQSEVGGALRGGTAGVRLLDAGSRRMADEKPGETHATAKTGSASPTSGTGFLLIPRPQIFGSDELSMRSSGLDELMPDAYLELSSADALALEVDAGHWVQAQGHSKPFTVRIDPMLSAGCIAYAPGLPQCLDFRPGQTLSVVRAARQPQRDGELIASDGVAG